jgi:hypothetical protein
MDFFSTKGRRNAIVVVVVVVVCVLSFCFVRPNFSTRQIKNLISRSLSYQFLFVFGRRKFPVYLIPNNIHIGTAREKRIIIFFVVSKRSTMDEHP